MQTNVTGLVTSLETLDQTVVTVSRLNVKDMEGRTSSCPASSAAV